MKNFLNRLVPAVLVIVSVGVIGYAIALGIAAFVPHEFPYGSDIRAWFDRYPGQNIGIPCSAIAAFAIVGAFWALFYQKDPDQKEPSLGTGRLSLTFFSLKFTGPSGPITLWLMCFLSFVFALWLLRAPEDHHANQTQTTESRSASPAQNGGH